MIRGDPAAADGDFEAALAADGVLDIVIRGFWVPPQVDRFFAALQPLHDAAVERHGSVLALILIESVQSPTVAFHVRDRALAMKRPGDRNAVVVASTLSRLQITRLMTTTDFGLFTDPASARTWLLA